MAASIDLQAIETARPAAFNAERWLSEARSLFDDAVASFQQREWKHIEQMAFYRGFQWGTATPIGWYQDEYEADEQREVLNMIRPTVRTSVADKLRNIPEPDAVPSSDDVMAFWRARASRRLVRSFTRNGCFKHDTMQRAETGVDIGGAGWYKTIWDPWAGKYLNGKPEGDIRVEFVDIVSGVCDPTATCEDEIGYVCHRKRLPVRTLDDRFPYDYFGRPTVGRWMKEPDDSGLQSRDRIENDGRAAELYNYATGSGRSPLNEVAELIEYWERPTNQFPLGRLIVFCGGVLIAAGPIPYFDSNSGDIVWPWILRLSDNIVPNGLFADGVVTDLVPLQRTINHNASKRKEWTDKILNPPLLSPIGSGIDPERYTDMAGEVISVVGGMMPKWMDVPDIPPSFFSVEGSMLSVLQTISGFSEISRGESPAGVDSGRAMAFLYQFQQGSREPSIIRFREDITRVLQNCLKLAKLFYSEGRITRQIGENNALSAVAFRFGDYDMDAEIRVEAFRGQPLSRATRFGELMDLHQMDALNPENPSGQRVIRLLGYDADDSEVWEDEQLHLRRARSEELEIAMDPFARLVVAYFERDDLHLDSHTRFANTEEFRRLPPQAQQSFLRHMGEHESNDASKQQAFAAQEQTLGGGTPPAPGPGLPPGAPADQGMESPMDGGMPFYGGAHNLDQAEVFASPNISAEQKQITGPVMG